MQIGIHFARHLYLKNFPPNISRNLQSRPKRLLASAIQQPERQKGDQHSDDGTENRKPKRDVPSLHFF
jgi:hypothetical protein